MNFTSNDFELGRLYGFLDSQEYGYFDDFIYDVNERFPGHITFTIELLHDICEIFDGDVEIIKNDQYVRVGEVGVVGIDNDGKVYREKNIEKEINQINFYSTTDDEDEEEDEY